MKNHEVIFSISFNSREVVKKFRTKISAESEVEAFDKCIAFAERKTKVDVISINETEFVVPEPETSNKDEEFDRELDEMIQAGKFAEAIKAMDDIKDVLARGELSEINQYLDNIRELGKGFLWIADILEKEE